MIKSGKTAVYGKSRIRGVVTSCPLRKIDNSFFSDIFSDDEILNISKMSGVKERYWVLPDQSGIDLSIAAANELLSALSWAPNEIDAIIYISQSPENVLPATSIRMAHMLGIPAGRIAFDVNLGCSGYPYGLFIAQGFIESGVCQKVLLVATEIPSRIADTKDRSTAMLFGDAGSVTALSSVEGGDVKSTFILGSDGSGADNLIIPNCRFSKNKLINDARIFGKDHDYLFMDGAEIFNFTIRTVPQLVADSVALNELEPNYYLMHQANLFMLNHIRKKLKISEKSMPVNIGEFGNTSVASIPLLFTSHGNKMLEGIECISIGMYGFGVGYSWASCISEISNDIFLKHIYV